MNKHNNPRFLTLGFILTLLLVLLFVYPHSCHIVLHEEHHVVTSLPQYLPHLRLPLSLAHHRWVTRLKEHPKRGETTG